MTSSPHLFLVGAGPGDPDLITMKAIKVLRSADAVLYDALANEDLLNYTLSTCKKLFVGKRYGCHALSQSEINSHIINYCNKYGKVVRLKGGDPFVFGRAQEEIEAVTAAGIPYSVVPGISSAIAVPEMMNIPLTCRGINESFWVTTGTTRSGEISGDIRLAAQSSATVVILMAMSKLELIMDLFKKHGKSDTPVALIQNGTTPLEKMVTGTVHDIVAKNEFYKLSNPAIIVIGEVVNLAKVNRNFSTEIQSLVHQHG